jgi:hypothetical protein
LGPRDRNTGSDTWGGIGASAEPEGSDRSRNTVNLCLNRQTDSRKEDQHQPGEQETISHTGDHEKPPPQLPHSYKGPNSLEVATGPKVARKICALEHESKPGRLGRGQRHSGCEAAQFEHTVPNVSILGQMRGSACFTAAGHHLVEWTAMAELGIEVPAKFTGPARTGVEAVDDGWVDVFHEEPAPGMARKESPGCEAESL